MKFKNHVEAIFFISTMHQISIYIYKFETIVIELGRVLFDV